MLALRVYVTCSLNWVYLEVIANIKCYLFTRKTQFYGKQMLRSTANKYVNIFGKYQHFSSDVYMYDIANMICHIYQYFIQRQHDINF